MATGSPWLREGYEELSSWTVLEAGFSDLESQFGISSRSGLFSIG